jgi:glycerophosphoryl diester phosphodiesterase
MNLLYELPQPIIFGHRGASAHAPENTISAFKLAIEHGADAIELDAKLTSDGQVVVIHDQTVNRTTNAYGEVKKLLLSTIRELDAGSFFSAKFAGEPVPTLEDVFEAVGKDIFINIELTNYISPRDPLPDKVALLVQKHGLEERVMFSSFLNLNLIRIKKLLPQVPAAVLANSGFKGSIARSIIGRRVSPEVIHPHFSDVSPYYMLQEKSTGRLVNVWTVNDPDEMMHLFALGVNGIITDDPKKACRVLSEMK